jgi:uncharacterized protein
MKKIIFVLLAVILASLCVMPVSAAEKQPLFVDGAELVTEAEEQKILSKLNSLSAEQEYDVIVITAETLGGKSSFAFARDSFISGGYGAGENKSGVILIIAMKERKWYLEFFGDSRLPEGTALSEYFLQDLKAGNYYSAIMAFADGAEKEFRFPLMASFGFSAIIGLVVAFISTAVMKGKLKSVHMQNNARNYIRRGSFNLTRSRDLYLYSTITRVPRPKNTGGGRMGGGGGGGSRGGGGGF